jgi:hypothetical protein
MSTAKFLKPLAGQKHGHCELGGGGWVNTYQMVDDLLRLHKSKKTDSWHDL